MKKITGYRLITWNPELTKAARVVEEDGTINVNLVFDDGTEELLTLENLAQIFELLSVYDNKNHEIASKYFNQRKYFNNRINTLSRDLMIYKDKIVKAYEDGYKDGKNYIIEKRNSHLRPRENILSDMDVQKIYKLFCSGMKKRRLAELYGVSEGTIRNSLKKIRTIM